MKKIILMLMVMVFLVSCGMLTTRKGVQEDTKNLLQEINPSTGEHYTPEEIREIKEIDSEVSYLDKLISTPIVILYTVGALIFIALTALCIYRIPSNPKMIWGAVASGSGAVICVLLPVLTIMFFEAMKILLYVFVGFAIIIGGIVAWYLWNRLSRKQKVAESLIHNIQDIKQKLTPQQLEEVKKDILDVQETLVKEEVKQVKGK
jgi:hypothetical protein